MPKTEQLTPRVLIVAGSDSGGGAGIQADIKTCAAFGVYSTTAITAITAQNTVGVQRIEALAPDLVVAQIQSVLSDIGTDVIKIGMLANQGIIAACAQALDAELSTPTIVLDPVLVATSGDKLLEDDAVATLREHLIPMADVITPNTYEAQILTGMAVETTDDMIKAGHALIEMGAGTALMKGGHLDQGQGASVTDILVSEQGNQVMNAPRINSRHTHGTGCTLASALASELALGMPLEEAVIEAREYVFEAIRHAPKLGSGRGPLNHGLVSPDGEAAHADDGNPFAVLKDLKS